MYLPVFRSTTGPDRDCVFKSGDTTDNDTLIENWLPIDLPRGIFIAGPTEKSLYQREIAVPTGRSLCQPGNPRANEVYFTAANKE
jgi:hypothetical protein